jgi:hypothetical protein
MVSSALPTLSIELDELFDRKLIRIDSAVSCVICEGLSPPVLIPSDIALIFDASVSSVWPHASDNASNHSPDPLPLGRLPAEGAVAIMLRLLLISLLIASLL